MERLRLSAPKAVTPPPYTCSMQLGSSEWEVVQLFVAAERALREAGAAVPPAGLSPAGSDQTMACLIAGEKVAAGLRGVMAEQAAQTGSWGPPGARPPPGDPAQRPGPRHGKGKEKPQTAKRL